MDRGEPTAFAILQSDWLWKRHETQQCNLVPLVVCRMELLNGDIYFFFSDRRVVRVVLISLLSYWSFCNRRPCLIVSSRGELRIWKGWGCSSEILNYTPKGDRSWRGPRFFWPLKETMLQHRQYIYIYLYFLACNPKRDLHG